MSSANEPICAHNLTGVAHTIRAPHFAVAKVCTETLSNDAAAKSMSITGTRLAIVQFIQTGWAVYAWELLSFFLRPASYLLLLAAALTAGWGFSWLVTILSRGATTALRHADDPIAQFLGPNVFLIGVCMLLIPLLTMNSIAEERRRATWEQLLTAPVSPLAVVFGKFAAAWSLLMIALSPWVYFVVVLRIWNGRMTEWHSLPWFDGPGLMFDMGPIWGGCLGLAVLGATLTALGLFCSGLCRSPASAAVLSMAALGLVLLTALAPRVLAYWHFSPSQIGLVESVSCWGHLEQFSRGTLEPRLVAGHISACSILLWNAAVICRRVDAG
jgi:ABC-2 type transport system permease protein